VVRAAAERWAHDRHVEATLHCGDETIELHA
jgi:hypothetical protein